MLLAGIPERRVVVQILWKNINKRLLLFGKPYESTTFEMNKIRRNKLQTSVR